MVEDRAKEADGDSCQSPGNVQRGEERGLQEEGPERMNNVSADIFKAVSLMEPSRKLVKMTEL